MSVELLKTLSVISYIAAGVFFLGALALFFILNVPKLVGYISGSTAKKAIEIIRRKNENTVDKIYQPGAVDAESGTITDKITHSGKTDVGVTAVLEENAVNFPEITGDITLKEELSFSASTEVIE